jgi:aryl-alcohol dehydrogenase-like predicted oxidoreductase
MAMKYRNMGRALEHVSEISLGTWAFSSTVYGKADLDHSIKSIRTAYEQGINLFDTAPLYGTPEQDGISEIVLGKGLEGIRDDVLISTKFGRKPSDDYKPNFYGAYATQSVEESLKRLGTDYIDILFFHSPFSPDEIHDDVWQALDSLKQSGKVRVIGHSISMFKDTQAMSREWAAERKIDVVQLVYSLMNRESADLIAHLGNQGVGILARETLANGFLTGAFKTGQTFPEGHLNNKYSREELDERIAYADQFNFLVRGDVGSMAQAALRWALDNPHVSSVLTGAINEQQLVDSCNASGIDGFTAEELDRANTLHTRDFEAA